MKLKLPALALLVGAVVVGTALADHPSRASDHDDGVTDTKTANLNLTDLYVFNENAQKGGADPENMVFVLNCNPKTPPKTQAYFNSSARYEFNISRVGTSAKNDDAPKGKPDVVLRFEFAAADANNVQTMTMTAVKDGTVQPAVTRNTDNSTLNTTPWGPGKPLTLNAFKIGDKEFTVFAGLREDPFFFDVNRFFALRAAAAEAKPLPTFAPTGDDFTKGLNVLSIVVRLQRSFLQEAAEPKSTTFDVWETIAVKK